VSATSDHRTRAIQAEVVRAPLRGGLAELARPRGRPWYIEVGSNDPGRRSLVGSLAT